MKKGLRRALFIGIPLVVIVGAAVGVVAFLNQTYHAVDVDKYLANENSIEVTETNDYIFFDSPNDKRAIVMYGGANVEEKSYSPLCRALAESDYDVFILKTFFQFPLLDANKADTVLSKFNYESVSLMGHSLGGVVATGYFIDSKTKIDNLIYLASFSNKDISNLDINVISIYGDLDTILNADSLNKSHTYMPSSFHELCIKGGNHAQFGSYGKQKKDGDATITLEEQTSLTKSFILEHII